MNYWYVMRVALGRECSIAEKFNQRIEKGEFPTLIRFLSPVEKEYYSVNGKKHIRDRVIYGGYLYLEASEPLIQEIAREIKKDADVKNFLGPENKPQLMSKYDVAKIIKDEVLEKRIADKTKAIDIGSRVKIIHGPFIEFSGNVSDINYDKNKVKVIVKIFDRETVVDLSFGQIEKCES